MAKATASTTLAPEESGAMSRPCRCSNASEPAHDWLLAILGRLDDDEGMRETVDSLVSFAHEWARDHTLTALAGEHEWSHQREIYALCDAVEDLATQYGPTIKVDPAVSFVQSLLDVDNFVPIGEAAMTRAVLQALGVESVRLQDAIDDATRRLGVLFRHVFAFADRELVSA